MSDIYENLVMNKPIKQGMYRVVLRAEDGYYTLADRLTEATAIRKMNGLKPAYGEGQELFIEEYFDA